MAELAGVRREETQKTQVDPETAERFIAEKRIGERIKRLRLKKSMGLVELGKHTGLSASFLSQLETGRVVPTLRNLSRIAMVFSKDLSYFFETEPNALFRIHRRKERVRLPQTAVTVPTYFFESLGYMVPDRHMDPYFAQFVPLTKDMDPKAHMHRDLSFCISLTGVGDSTRRSDLNAGARGRGLFRRRYSALLSMRGQQTGRRDYRNHSPDKCHALRSRASTHANSSPENHACESLSE